MDDDITKSAVREWLRDHGGQAHCAGCIARDLQLPGLSWEELWTL
jgi:hypothetical protein